MGLKSQHPDCNNGRFKHQERKRHREAVRKETITRVRDTDGQNIQKATETQKESLTVRATESVSEG